jgi:hypothetical protein
MSNTPRIVLRPNPGVTTEQACNARARAWTYAFQSFYRRNGKRTVKPASEPDTRDDAKE